MLKQLNTLPELTHKYDQSFVSGFHAAQREYVYNGFRTIFDTFNSVTNNVNISDSQYILSYWHGYRAYLQERIDKAKKHSIFRETKQLFSIMLWLIRNQWIVDDSGTKTRFFKESETQIRTVVIDWNRSAIVFLRHTK